MTRTSAGMIVQMLGRNRFTAEQIAETCGCTEGEVRLVARKCKKQVADVFEEYKEVRAIYEDNLERTKTAPGSGRPPFRYLKYEIGAHLALQGFQAVRFRAPRYHEVGGIAW